MDQTLTQEIVKGGILLVAFAWMTSSLLKGVFITRKHHEDVVEQINKNCEAERERAEYFRAAFERSDQRFSASVEVTHEVMKKVADK